MAPGKRRGAGNVSDVDPRSFGGHLRRLREEAGLTQTELGNAVGLPQARVSEYERNAHQPSEETIIALAEALHVPAGQLFEGSRWDGALPLGPEIRETLKKAHAEDWQFFTHYLDTMDGMTPELRKRFLQGYRNFLEIWDKE